MRRFYDYHIRKELHINAPAKGRIHIDAGKVLRDGGACGLQASILTRAIYLC